MYPNQKSQNQYSSGQQKSRNFGNLDIDDLHRKGYNTIKSIYNLRQSQTHQALRDSRRKSINYSMKIQRTHQGKLQKRWKSGLCHSNTVYSVEQKAIIKVIWTTMKSNK
jgi:hypothetical protein